MATVNGSMLTTNILSDQAAIDLGDKITMLEPSATPLTVWSTRASKKRTVATTFSWLEDRLKARFDTVNGAIGARSMAFTVADKTGCSADKLKKPSLA